MKTLFGEFRRILRNKSFYAAAALTVGMFCFEMSSEMDLFLFSEEETRKELLKRVLCGEGNLLFLPLLSCLPNSACVYQELRTGAARYKIFRCGYRRYQIGKLFSILLSAVLSQWLGAAVFQGIFSWAGGLWISLPAPLLLQRLAVTGIYAMIGNIGALLTKDTVSAYVFPVVFAFSLSMLQSRFFFHLTYINPAAWVSGEGLIPPFLAVLFAGTILLTSIFTEYEVKKHA